MNNKWVRSISFNRTNPDDIARLKLIGKKSFSRYIKKLLDEEIKRNDDGKPLQPVATTNTATPQQPQGIVARFNNRPIRPIPPPFNPMLQDRQRRD